MAYLADGVDVGSEPEFVCAVSQVGVIVQNLEGPPVTLGGKDVAPGKGLRLAVEDGWQFLPGGYSAPIGLNVAPVPLELYGVTESGKARVAFLRHDLPPS